MLWREERGVGGVGVKEYVKLEAAVKWEVKRGIIVMEYEC